MKRPMILTVAVYSLFSAAALVLQTVWQRELVIIFGGALESTAVILAAWMAGLAGGALFFSRRRFRMPPFRMLALLAGATVIMALLFPFARTLLLAAGGAYADLFETNRALYHLITTVAVFIAVAIPAFFVGGAFPVIVRCFGASFGGRVPAILFGASNAASALGAVLCGFVLLETFGAFRTSLIAAVVLISTGIAALILSRKVQLISEDPQHAGTGTEKLSPQGRAILILFFLSGFTSLSYELLYNRVLIYFVGNNTHSFSIIVAVFIGGFMAGNLVYLRLRRRAEALPHMLILLAVLQGAIALWNMALPYLTLPLNDFALGMRDLLGMDSYPVLLLARSLSAVLALAITAVCFGAAYPLFFALIPASRGGTTSSAREAGLLAAINTAGTVAGPLVTGFVLVSVFQVSGTLRLLAFASLMIAITAFALGSYRLRRVPVMPAVLLVCAALAALIPAQNRIAFFAARNTSAEEVIFFREGPAGTVSVSRDANNIREIKINGVGEVPTDRDSLAAFYMLGHLPFMSVPEARSAACVAFGGGITFGSVSRHQLDRAVCIEICGDVLTAAPLYTDLNNRVYENPAVDILVADGRKFLSSTREKFDVVISDSTHPASFESWILYTREFYAACRDRLNTNGVFAQWIPIHDLAPEDFRTIIATIHTAFPNVRVYLSNAYTVVVASDASLAITEDGFNRIAARDTIRTDLASVGIRSLDDLNARLIFNEADAAAFAAGAPVARDDRSPLQFSERRSFGRMTVAENMETYLRYAQKNGNPFLTEYLSLRIPYEAGDFAAFARLAQRKTYTGESAELVRMGLKRAYTTLAGDDRLRAIFELDGPDAVARMDELLDIFPGNGYLMSYAAYLHLVKLEDRPAALSIAEKALRVSPRDPRVLRNIMKIAAEAGDAALSLRSADAWLAVDPWQRDAAALKLKVLRTLNRTAEAERFALEYEQATGSSLL